MAWGQDDAKKIIHIDIDETQIGRSARVDVGIHAALGDALPLLLDEIEPLVDQNSDWLDRVAMAKSRRATEYQQRLAPQLGWLNAIRAALPPEGIFVDELTQTGYVSRFAFPTFGPRRFISTGYQGTLGYGVPTALVSRAATCRSWRSAGMVAPFSRSPSLRPPCASQNSADNGGFQRSRFR